MITVSELCDLADMEIFFACYWFETEVEYLNINIMA